MTIVDKIMNTFAPYFELDETQLRVLDAIGIYNCKKDNCDGEASRNYVVDHRSAFKNVCGESDSPYITWAHFFCLEMNKMEKIADLIEGSEAFNLMLNKDLEIRMGRENKVLGHRRQKELIAYIQIGLNEFYKKDIAEAKGSFMAVPVDGVFSDDLRVLLQAFSSVFISKYRKIDKTGSTIDFHILSTLAEKLKQKREIISALKNVPNLCNRMYLGAKQHSNDCLEAQEIVASAFEYLGIRLSYNVHTSCGLHNLAWDLSDFFKDNPYADGPSIVGKEVVSRILKKVEGNEGLASSKITRPGCVYR